MKIVVVLLFLAGMSFNWLAQTPEEQEYQKWMRTVNATMGSLRTNIKDQSADAAAKDAAVLVDIFKKSEKFWAGRKKDNAVEWSKQAAAAASEVEAAAKAKEFAKAGAAAGKLYPFCASCHGVYREKLPDGTYRFRK